MQSIGGDKNEPKAEHQSAPPHSPCPRGARMRRVAPILAVYAREYWSDASHPRSARAGRMWWSGLMLCLGLVLITSNGLHFLIGWELFTLCAYFLVTLDRSSGEVRTAGWLYLCASHLAALC